MIKNTIIEELISNLKRININDIASKAITTATLNDAVDLNLEQLGDGELNSGEALGNDSGCSGVYESKIEEGIVYINL